MMSTDRRPFRGWTSEPGKIRCGQRSGVVKNKSDCTSHLRHYWFPLLILALALAATLYVSRYLGGAARRADLGLSPNQCGSLFMKAALTQAVEAC